MSRSSKRGLLAAVGAVLLSAGIANAAFITGNLVVVQVGDGAAALSSAATPGFLQEFTTAGSGVGSPIALPTVGSGANKRLTLSGTSTSEGFLTMSPDGQYMSVAGYDAATGTASITGSNAFSGFNRVVGRVDMSGAIDTTTAYQDNVNLGNARSSVIDGSNVWLATSATGIRYLPFGTAGNSTQISPTPTNVRVLNIYNSQLYTSSASGTTQGVLTIGTGEPTTSGQSSTLLNGFPTASGPGPYDYYFADANTLYVADDRTSASNGGIQKWTLSAGTWSLQYTLNVTATSGIRGLAASTVSGVTTLYGTTTESSANKLVTVTDTGAGSLYTTLATAAANTAFRGVEVIVPEPASLGLVAMGLLALRRRR